MIRSTIPISVAIRTAATKDSIGPAWVFSAANDGWLNSTLQKNTGFSGTRFISPDNGDESSMIDTLSKSNERSLIITENKHLFRLCNWLVKDGFRRLPKALLVLVLEDFAMHGEYYAGDTRQIGRILRIPVLEPATYQETVDAIGWGTHVSEKTGLPVLIRLSKNMFTEKARVFYNHSHADPEPAGIGITHTVSPEFPDSQEIMLNLSAQSDMNRFAIGSNRSLGILACGITFPLVMEIKDKLDLEFPVLKIGQYPLPGKLMHKLFAECREVLVLEEGEHVYEEWIRGYFDQEQIKGRLDGTLPRVGELTPPVIVNTLLRR